MITSRDGIELIQHFESCELEAYPDPKSPLAIECRRLKIPLKAYTSVPDWQNLSGSPWTVGWGHTGKDVSPGTVWTQGEADRALMIDLADFEEMVMQYVTAHLNQAEFDAMVSILMNVGPGSKTKDGIVRLRGGQPSTLLRKLNALDYEGAADQFLRWISPGTSVERGLKRRRTAERAMFLGKSWRAVL